MGIKYFGTDGVRGRAGEHLTPQLAYKIGRYIGGYNNEKEGHLRVLVGRDTRESGDMLASALITGMLESGADVFYADVTTTPSISYLVINNGFDFGVMISASHNPYYDNGIKVFNAEGEKISHDLEVEIEKYIDSEEDYVPKAGHEHIGRLFQAQYLVDAYIDFLYLKGREINSPLRIAVDCANGSASNIAPRVFKQLGIKASFIHNDPTGININENCGSTHLESLKSKMRTRRYDAGFAFDGDADRVMIIAPDGRTVDGDGIIYLNAVNMKKRGRLKKNKVVLTVMSNLGVKNSLKAQGIEVLETDVGDKYVQQAIKEKGLSLGGEKSGHIIFGNDLNTGDGILTAIKILKAMHYQKQSLEQLLEGFVELPQTLKSVSVLNKAKTVEDPDLLKFVEKYDKQLGDNGRVLLRASGTENLIRIMVEAPEQAISDQIVDEIVAFINEHLASVN